MVGELESDRYVGVRHTRVVDHDQEVVTPTGRIRPNMRQFSDAERAILDATITEFRGYTNTKSSDRSHERSAGWLAFNQGETIPYRTSIISPEPVSDDVVAYMERAEELIG
jgi:hypothetical protein